MIVGDHGFGTGEQLSSINMLNFHIPLLLIGHDLRKRYDPIQKIVGTQVDVAPTIMGLMGFQYQHQCWGRDLLSLGPDDKGFGFIKPSGGSQTVAFIEGDHILVKVHGAGLELGEYHLGKQNTFKLIHDQARIGEMNAKLKSFVQIALRALMDNKTGLD